MSSYLDSLMVESPAPYTFTEEYRSYIESLLPLLRAMENNQVIEIGVEDAFLYRFDLEGFLLKHSVQIEDHYLIMRVNDIDNSFTFGSDYKTLIVPNMSLVNKCKSLFVGKMKT